MTDEIYGLVHLADDVRYEYNNKQTIVGLYSDYLVANSFPSIIEKLAIGINLVWFGNRPDVFDIHISTPEKKQDVEMSLDFSDEDLTVPEGNKQSSFIFWMYGKNIEIPEAGSQIEVTVTCDKKTITRRIFTVIEPSEE
ncbi:DUF6941 family protein [Eilatimonas milleporae]|uniref:Uncharacterized protein n=1 Tax=Eilatimonas milleporae TaxID=911205 RepID=A0A3M0CR29_9PROT|nr:hypothetical protein [Eilatimonas milleporae]RMB11938.1 hypothetical protein BXY39_0425 [Eilatimonas milleporae]